MICIFEKCIFMGLIYADIELINGEDIVMARRGYMDRDEIKRIKLNSRPSKSQF